MVTNNLVSQVKTPIGVIALFVTLVEISGNVVLPWLSNSNQNIYLWFLMIFPILLLFFFFFTLWFNPLTLYAPHDFQCDASFLKVHHVSDESYKRKLASDIRENETAENDDSTMPLSVDATNKNKSSESLMSTYFAIEIKALHYLEKKYKTIIKQGVSLSKSDTIRNIWDGFFTKDKDAYLVEVKYYLHFHSSLMFSLVRTIKNRLTHLDINVLPVHVIVLIVTKEDLVGKYKDCCNSLAGENFIVDVQFEVISEQSLKNS